MRPVGRPAVFTTFAVFPLLTTECPILMTLEHPILMTSEYPILMTLEHPVLMTLEVGKNTELFLNDQFFSDNSTKINNST